MKIFSRYDATKVLFECAAKTILETVVEAFKNKINLSGADLSRANLYGADLSRANLSRANLSGANLYGANLNRANLSGADLSRANLSRANLSGANLYGANLNRANLSGADLSRANLYGADLSRAKNISPLANAQTSIVPDSGPFFGWKKCRNGVIVHLAIGAKAKRSNATGRKCRAEYVKVLEVIGGEIGISMHNSEVVYRKGEVVRCDKWEEDRWVECGGGLHFYLTRVEAENHF